MFSNNDINKFILWLRKIVYPYDYMNRLEKFNKTTLPENEEFYSNLNMEEITGAGYMDGRFCKDFEIKKLGKYHDLYLERVIYYFWLIFLKTCLKNVFKNLSIRSRRISFSSWIGMVSSF